MLDVDFLTAEGAHKLTDGELVLSEEQVLSDGTPAVGVEVGVAREVKEEVEDRSGSSVVEENKESNGEGGGEGGVGKSDLLCFVGVASALPPSPRERLSSQESQDKEELKPRTAPTLAQAPLTKPEPTRLLDELFRKTKATPCIYWLPLTDVEVCVWFSVSLSVGRVPDCLFPIPDC